MRGFSESFQSYLSADELLKVEVDCECSMQFYLDVSFSS